MISLIKYKNIKLKMEKIFHIPHSSLYIPPNYINEYVVSKEKLEYDVMIMSDIKTNEFVDSEDCIIFPYSRLFCDVERFNSDEEEMNSVGMGVLYNKNHNLEIIRPNPSKDIMKYYEEHHNILNTITSKKLLNNKELLFIDLHSYSEKPLKYELHKDKKRPEICIGINERYNKNILEIIINIINKYGYIYIV